MDDQRKDQPDPKWSKKSNRQFQLRTYNLPTDDVENTNGIN